MRSEVAYLEKRILRQTAMSKLKSLTKGEKIHIEGKIFDTLINSDIWKKANVIGLTIAQDFEWNTQALIEMAWKQNKTIVIPKCYPQEKKLVFYKFTSYNQLENVYMNLREPKPIEHMKINKNEIDLLIVPGLLFDYEGYRIGFGGGYYDRFLKDFPSETVAMCCNDQLKSNLPKEPYDIPVDHLVTETGLIR